MRRTLFSFLLGLLLLTVQEVFPQSFNGGLLAGVTFSQVDGDHYAGFHKLGLTAGTYISLPVSRHLDLQMELKYTQMGAHSSHTEVVEYGYQPYDLTLHYAEIPMMLRCNFGRSFALEAGASLDFLLKQHGELDATTQYWKLNFFSITGNFGMHFLLTRHLGLGARMMYSITPMQTNPTPLYWFDHSYNKVVQFTLTYNFLSPAR